MDFQAKILALLHGEMGEGKQLSELLSFLARSPEQQREFVDQIALSRRYLQFGSGIVPTTSADKMVWDRISALQSNQAKRPAGENPSILSQLSRRWIALQVHAAWVVVAIVVGIGIGYLLGGENNDPVRIASDHGVAVESRSQDRKLAVEPTPLPPSYRSEAAADSGVSGRKETDRKRRASLPSVSFSSSEVPQARGILRFDGKDDLVSVPEFSIDLNSDFTVEANVRLDNIDQTAWIVSYNVPDEKGNLLLGVENGRVRFLTYDVYDVANELMGTAQLKPGKWYRIAAVQDVSKGVIQLYVDGVLSEEAKFTPLASSEQKNGRVLIGAREWFSTDKTIEHLDGNIRDVGLWSRTFRSSELKQNGAEQKKGMVAFWPLDEKEGDIAGDLSGIYNGNVQGEPARSTTR